jgi:CRISPR-associated DxTHG motif protein
MNWEKHFEWWFVGVFVVWVVGIDYIFIEGLTQQSAGDQFIRLLTSLFFSAFVSAVCLVSYLVATSIKDIIGALVWLALMGIWSLPAPLLPLYGLLTNPDFDLSEPLFLMTHGLNSGPLLALVCVIWTWRKQGPFQP